MFEFLKNLFASESFIPHGHCYLWKSELVWLHIVSDSLIALAYYSIPITLLYFVRKRQDLPFNWIFLLFGTFIIACGTTHLMEIWTLWHPTYWLSGAVKSATATVSVYTALELVPLVPKALALPSPAQLEATNRELLHQITERKQAEEQIRTLNAELERRVIDRTAQLAAANKSKDELLVREQTARQQVTNILESISDAFFAVDNEWLFTYMNPRTEQLMQRSRDELLGKNIWEELPEAIDSIFYREYHRAVAENVTVQFEAFYASLNIWVDVRTYPAANGLSVYLHDITDRKQAEAERDRLLAQLDSERSYLEAVLQQMPSGVAISEADSGKLILHNSEAIQLLRHPLLPVDDYKGYAQYGAFHADGQPYAPEEYPIARSVISGEVVKQEEMIYRRGDGTWTFFSVNAAPIRSQDGRIIAAVSTFHDISKRKQNEEALKKSEERYRSLVVATSQIVWTTNPDGWVVDMPQWRAYTGQSQEAVKGWGWLDALHPEDRDRTAKIWSHAVATKSLYDVEYRVRGDDGNYRYFSVRGVPVLAEDGSIREWIGTCANISDRKHAEQQIRELNQDLERRVLERTAQLEAANKELEAFCYSVSHDLRTPLRSIDGFSLALLERYASELDDKGKHYLQRVRTATQRMGQLIEDLLNLSRVTRTPMQRDCVDLTAIVKEIAQELQQTQPERTVEFDIAPAVVAQGDPRLLRVVLENLLNNAWKFTSKTVQPRISFGTTVEQDGLVTYFVTDNGAGFDMAYADKLFGAFQRLHTEQEFPGTGIGLATVARIVHRHGGRVWAEGTLEQGARFYFTL